MGILIEIRRECFSTLAEGNVTRIKGNMRRIKRKQGMHRTSDCRNTSYNTEGSTWHGAIAAFHTQCTAQHSRYS